MSNERFAYGVFIGRFQPLHMAHQQVIAHALTQVDKLILLLGSATSPRTIRNPFTFEERKEFILNAFPHDRKRIIIRPLQDMPYRDQEWVKNVQETVDRIIEEDHPGWTDKPLSVALVGSQKDNSGYYLSLFPQWGSIPHLHIVPLNATDIRRVLFGTDAPDEHHVKIKEWIDPAVMDKIEPLLSEQWAYEIISEYDWNAKYRSQWSNTPYPVNFVTTDAVVICSGHVLMIQRKHRPGMGKWALPGGFLNTNEKVEDATIRELVEETKIDVSRTLLQASFKDRRIFDDPLRSERGRIMTVASLYVLPNMKRLPKIKAADDAKDAKWVPLGSISEAECFEDHYAILNVMASNL